MNRIIDGEPLDIFMTPHGIMYVLKDYNSIGKKRPAFYTRDPLKRETIDATVSAYMLAKFGGAYEQTAKRLKNFLSCETCVLPGGDLAVVYPTGEFGHFDHTGKIIATGDCMYDGSPARSCALDGEDIWLAVPGKNAVVKLSMDDHKIMMRIGAGANTSFSEPVAVFCDKGQLFVCNKGSGQIMLVDTATLNVNEYTSFKEPVLKYFRIAGKEYFALQSGVYESD